MNFNGKISFVTYVWYSLNVLLTINSRLVLVETKDLVEENYIEDAATRTESTLPEALKYLQTKFRDFQSDVKSEQTYLNSFLKQLKSDTISEKYSNNKKDVTVDDIKNKIKSNKLKDIAGSIDTSNFRYSVDLNTDKKIKLFWDIYPVEEKVTLQLHAHYSRTDVIGFGFSDYGEVSDADFFIMWTNQEGRHFATDVYTDSDEIIHIDTQQDYSLDGVDVENGEIIITFSRRYDTCDDQDYMIDPGTTHILFFNAPGRINEIEGMNATLFKAQLQRVQLLKSQLEDPALPDDTKTFTMTVDKVHVPTQETTYWCQVQLLPELKTKHHIIQFDGAVSKEANGIVHHMEVFHCDVPGGTHLIDYNAPCRVHGAERPKGLESCRQVIGAWAMGAKGLSYPKEAGYAVGGEGFSRYVMLEVHYNNPNLKAGVIDSSGIKFYVTKQLRQYDAGIMELGMEYTDKYAIPPHQELWSLNGYCIPECTQIALPPKGIKVFGSQLHTHLTGKKAFTKHYRNGIELPELNRDNHYSPHYQEIRTLHRQVAVLPGDSLVTTCQDGTLDKNNITMGGFAITDEMCVNYIHYYPKAELEVCKSSVTTKSLYGFFKFMKHYQWENTSMHKGILDNFKSITWKPMNVQLLNTFMNFAPLSMQCNQSDGNRFPGSWENKPIPKVLKPSPPEERLCLT